MKNIKELIKEIIEKASIFKLGLESLRERIEKNVINLLAIRF